MQSQKLTIAPLLDTVSEVAIITTDEKGAIIIFNKQAEKILGYSYQEVTSQQSKIAKRLQAELHSFKEVLYTSWQEKARESEPVTHISSRKKWTFIRKDQSEGKVNLIINAIYNATGELAGFLILITDIDPDQKAKEYLRVRKNQMHFSLTDTIPKQGIFITDAHGDCLYANSCYVRITGSSEEQAFGKGWYDTIYLADKKSIMEAILYQDAFDSVLRIVRPNQQIIWTNVKTILIRNNNTLLGCVGVVEEVTNRKPVEESIKGIDPSSGLLVEREIDEIIAFHEPSGRFSYLSPAVTTILGYQPGELIGISPCVLFHTEDKRLIKDQLHQICLDNASQSTIQCRIRNKEKQYLTFDISIQSILDEEGNLIHLQTVSTLVKSEVRFIEQVAKQSSLLEATHEALLNFINGNYSYEHVFAYLLNTLLKTTGSTFGFIGKAISGDGKRFGVNVLAIDDVSWDDKAKEYYQVHKQEGLELYDLKSLYDSVMLSGNPLIVNHSPVDQYDPAVHSFLAIPFKSADRLVGVMGIANRSKDYDKEIIELLNPFIATCTALLVSLENTTITSVYNTHTLGLPLLMSIANSLPSALCVIDTGSKRIIYANNRFYKLWQAESLEEKIRQDNLPLSDWMKLCLPALAKPENFAQSLDLLVSSNELQCYEEEIVLQNKQIVNWLVNPVNDSSIKVQLHIFEDVTEQKRRENELVKAKQQAEEAAMAKQHFLSSMSHEIRTPMNAVIGITHLLLQENPKPEQMENLKTLKFSSDNLLVLINDILDFSKIEAGKISFEEIDFNLKDLILNIRNSLNYKAFEKGINVTIFVDSKLPEVLVGDPVRLAQVLNNLISNAIKFTEVGTVTIDVGMEGETEDSAQVRFKVIDTGIGISKDKQEYIFESFTQATSDVTRRFGGTGLGLTITRRLLELQNSQIYVESKVGSGSTFYFTLNFKKSLKKQVIAPGEPVDYSDANLSHIRLLLVEDNEVNQFVAAKFLSKLKIIPDFANNGQLALEKIKSKEYDIILMDLQMPEMDGYEATKAIRQLKDVRYKEIPIIAVTAAVVADTKEKALEAGITDFTSKPINPSELYQKIMKYVPGINEAVLGQEKANEIQPLVLSPLNYKNLLQICGGDVEAQQQILSLSKNSFAQFKANYEQALLAKDSTQLDAAAHYMKTLFHILEITELINEVRHGKEMINNLDATQDEFKHSINKVFGVCDRIISDLEEMKSLV